ncbi:MAG: 50S ribosomal protein L10, partial [Treponema sp.]
MDRLQGGRIMAIMGKTQPAKTAAIEEAKKILSEYKEFIFVEYRGLTVEQITKLRKSLREKDATIK